MHEEILYNLTVKKVYSVINLRNDERKETKRTNRPCWGIILKYEGETVYQSNGKTYISNAENMIILPKGCSYSWTCTKAGRYYAVEFDCDETCEELFSIPVSNHEKILSLLKETESKRLLKRQTYKLEVLKSVYTLLLLLLQEKKQEYLPLNKQEKIAPAVQYMLEHYTKPIKNDYLASLTGLSTVYFRKLFTQAFGCSPIAYLQRLRMKKAKEMLKSDYTNLGEIAYSLGYTDCADFSRTFKKHFGISPSRYQKTKL